MSRDHPYKSAGLYEDSATALAARRDLVGAGIPRERIALIGPDDEAIDADIEPEPEEVRRTAVRDLLAGAGTGGVAGVTAVGALGGIAGIPLVVAQPLAATAIGAAYGCAVGTLAGGATALGTSVAGLAALLRDEIANGRWALLVHSGDERERDQVLARLAGSAAETHAGR